MLFSNKNPLQIACVTGNLQWIGGNLVVCHSKVDKHGQTTSRVISATRSYNFHALGPAANLSLGPVNCGDFHEFFQPTSIASLVKENLLRPFSKKKTSFSMDEAYIWKVSIFQPSRIFGLGNQVPKFPNQDFSFNFERFKKCSKIKKR